MIRLRWTETAQDDLLGIHDRIAEFDIDAARGLPDRVLTAVKILAVHPLVGRVGRVSGTRELVIDRTPYIVAYRVLGETVEILRVRHGAQRWPRAL